MASKTCPCICFFIVISMIVGFVFFVFWLTCINADPEIHVMNASLTHFKLTAATITTTTTTNTTTATTTTTNTTTATATKNHNKNLLSYRLTLDIRLSNPSRTIGIRYHFIRVGANYKSKTLALITLPPFYQGHKSTTILHQVVFQGESFVELKKSELKGFDKDQRLGRFDIRIAFESDLTTNLGRLKYDISPTILCDLKLPLASYINGTATGIRRSKTKKCYTKPEGY